MVEYASEQQYMIYEGIIMCSINKCDYSARSFRSTAMIFAKKAFRHE